MTPMTEKKNVSGIEFIRTKSEKVRRMQDHNKVTPLHDLTWYVKWFSTLLVIVAVVCRSLELHLYDLVFSLLGVIGWTFVGLKWHDRFYSS